MLFSDASGLEQYAHGCSVPVFHSAFGAFTALMTGWEETRNDIDHGLLAGETDTDTRRPSATAVGQRQPRILVTGQVVAR